MAARRTPYARVLAVALAVLVAAATALAAAGCGKETVSVQTVAKAATATSEAGGFKLAIEGSFEVAQLDRTLPIKGEGVLDPQRRRGKLTFDSALLAAVAGGSGARVEEIFDGLVIYMRMPEITRQLGSDKEWLKIDLGRAGKQLGLDVSQFTQLSNDPRQMLDQLKGVSGDVEKIGEDDVRGTETTHYRAEVDLRRYPDRLPPEQREAARQSVERLIETSGRSSYPMEIWIDDGDLVRRVKIAYSIKAPGQDDEASFSLAVEFFDFGTPVTVEPPPADQVQDVTELGRGAGGGGGSAPAQP